MMSFRTRYDVVIPAKAGIHFDDRTGGAMDLGLRRDDDCVRDGGLAARRAG
jgi:hypothetical protein